jgi:hypothetical protein
MKKLLMIAGITVMAIAPFSSCKKKSSDEKTNISVPPLQIGVPISPGNVNGGSVKGTMTTGNTYTILNDITVNAGDTLLLQSGVTVCVKNSVTIIVKGVLISLGTQAQPNYFTSCGASKINTIAQGDNPSTDPAFNGPTAGSGWWTGINCDTSCKLLCLKWTHVDFAGATFPVTENFVGGTQGSISYAILFQNPVGNLIIEDSWIYGNDDDAVRIQCGHISIMRNTFEKNGLIGGDVLNAKSGTVGDMAYNLFMGTCTNGTKASNKGGQPIQCNVNMYNNTYVDGGYRQAGQAGRSGGIDYEQGAKGMAYNNLLVNCRVGFRIVNNPIADTANCFYGNNYSYGDSVSVVDQTFPVEYITKPNAYYYPTAAQCGYVYNTNGAAAYDASALAGQGNPMFVNFPLPEPGIIHLYDIAYVGNYNFRLQPGSPCLNHGYTSFTPLHATNVTNPNFAATVTPPGKDIGCYQNDGSGNQH